MRLLNDMICECLAPDDDGRVHIMMMRLSECDARIARLAYVVVYIYMRART